MDLSPKPQNNTLEIAKTSLGTWVRQNRPESCRGIIPKDGEVLVMVSSKEAADKDGLAEQSFHF